MHAQPACIVPGAAHGVGMLSVGRSHGTGAGAARSDAGPRPVAQRSCTMAPRVDSGFGDGGAMKNGARASRPHR
jgi:hypothetical protein